MEDNANTNINADSTVEEIVLESKSKEEKNEVTRLNDDAGPSRIPLPGAVQTVKSNIQTKPGLSKSEHNLRHIITTKDVTNALKSLNFGPTAQIPKSLNLNEIKVNLVEEEIEGRTDSTTLIDLKKFMASCFKFNKDASNAMLLAEMPNNNVQNVRPVIAPTTNEKQGASNNVQAENISTKNEVIISTHGSKHSKGEKKKTSGNLSERSELAVTQRDSLSSIGSNVCRICMTRGKERLISPCNCKGSLANVHLTCLERWLNQVGRNHCELCGFSYPAIRTPRYTVLQALRLWFGNPRNRSHLQSDCLIFWLLSTVTAGLLAVCIVGTQYFVMEGSNFGKLDPSGRKDEGISHRITETAMDFFMAIVLCGYSVTVYLLWKDHYVMWNRWRRANVNVRLLLSPDANPVPFVPRNRYNVV